MGTLQVAPIDPFQRLPASLLVLPDGRFVLPETEGVWIHVVGPDGRGLTRLGGQSAGPLGALETPAGKFRSLSGVALTPQGKLLAADQTSEIVSVFNASLEPESTLTVPRARSVWQIEALHDGRMAAAVAPRHPTAGGQVVIFHPEDSRPGESATTHLPQDPIFRHNRWQRVSATRMEVLGDGRILAYWAPFPWAKVLSARGDSIQQIGDPTKRYRAPSSGPEEKAALETVEAWFASFTPLLGIEGVGPVLVFQFLSSKGEEGGEGASARGAGEAASRGKSSRGRLRAGASTSQLFIHLYDAGGKRIATDLLLPAGSRILESNDRSRLYLLRRASARGLEIEVWEPDPASLSRPDRPSSLLPARLGRSRSGPAAGRSRAMRSAGG